MQVIVGKQLVRYGLDPGASEEPWEGQLTEEMGGSRQVLERLDLRHCQFHRRVLIQLLRGRRLDVEEGDYVV